MRQSELFEKLMLFSSDERLRILKLGFIQMFFIILSHKGQQQADTAVCL